MNFFKDDILIKERVTKLIRKGSLLNTLGVLRTAIIYNGCLSLKEYIKVINLNFMIKGNSDQTFENRIITVWNNAREKIALMNLIDLKETTESKICLVKK